MQTSKNILASFLIGFSLVTLTSCATSAPRYPASDALTGTTLTGTRVNPLNYTLAPKWKVKLHDGQKNNWESGKLNFVSYELGTEKGFADFKARIQALRDENDKAAANHKKGKGIFPKGSVLALNEIAKLLVLIESRRLSEHDRVDALVHIAELASSFSLEFQYPVPKKIWALIAPVKLAALLVNKPMDTEAGPATNLPANIPGDTSKVDPVKSSFWQNPGDIRSRDMYAGFHRAKLPEFKTPCKYDEPKSNYGISAGFELKCDGKTWKFKFSDETNTEPFNSRLVNLMGYNAIPVDYVGHAFVEYDRGLLSEFNSRKELTTKISSLLGFNYYKIKQQIYEDPFKVALQGAYLKDGSFVDSEQLRLKLLKVQTPEAEKDDANYNTEFESKIKLFVLRPASAEAKPDDNEKNVGPWSWNDLDHPDRREVRAFAILAAYLNLYDVRTDNTKVRFVTDASGAVHMKHFISDLGSGLGAGSSLLNQFDGAINKYPWKVMEAITEKPDSAIAHAAVRKPKRFVERYVIKGYSVIQPNAAFDRVQVEDARWLVRRLAQVTEAQLQDALIASGWSAAETKLLLEKLVARRDNLVTELELMQEFPLLRPQKIDKKFNYDPKTEKPITVSRNSNIVAPVTEQKIVDGSVVLQRTYK